MPSFKDPLYLWGLPYSLIFGGGGVMHFVMPPFYLKMMESMPLKELHPQAVFLSGIAETACGLGFLLQPSTTVVNWTIATLSAISPVHYYMWKSNGSIDGVNPMTQGEHAFRAILQGVFFYGLIRLRKAYIAREAEEKSKSDKKE